MKLRYILFSILIAAALSGCGIEANNTAVNKAPAKASTQNNTQNQTVSKSVPVSKALTIKNEAQTAESKSLEVKLSDYLSSEANRNSIAKRAYELHGGTYDNSCVYFASEALRRVGVKLPDSMSWIPTFIDTLKEQGFKTSYNLKDLQPGDICFTTDVKGVIGGRPTHTFIFMGWQSPGVAMIVDNQVEDYGNVYHPRLVKAYYLNNQKDLPKEATAFFMYK